MSFFGILPYPMYTLALNIINLFIGGIGLPVTVLIFISMRPLLKSNQTTNIRLVLVVLLVDLITCGTLLIEAVAGFIRPDYLFEVPTLCKLAHLFAGGSTFCSIWFLAIVSFERYTHIVMEKTLKNIYWYLIMVVVSCFYIGTSIYSMVEDSIKPNDLGVYCFVDSKKAEGKVLFYIVTILNITSILTVVFSYISIAKTTLKMKNKAKVSNPERVTDLDRTLTIAFLKIFGIVTFYLITNSFETYLQVYEIFSGHKRSPIMDVISTALINSNPVVNSILLLLINKEVGNRFYGRFLYKEIELTTTNITNLP